MKGAIACVIRASDQADTERISLELTHVRTVAQTLGLSVVLDTKSFFDLPSAWEAISSIAVAFVAIDSSSEDLTDFERGRLAAISKEVPVALLTRKPEHVPQVTQIPLGTQGDIIVDALLDFLHHADESSTQSLSARYKATTAFALTKGFEEMQRPLSEILAKASMLSETNPEAQTQLINTIQNAASIALFRMHNLSDLANMNSPHFAFEAEPFRLDSVIGFCGKIAQARANRTRHEFLLHVDPLIPNKLVGDAKRLQQIIVNLLESPLLSQQPSGIILSIFLEERRETSVILRFSVASSSGKEPVRGEKTFQNLGELLEYAGQRSDASQTWLATAYRSIQRLGGALSLKGGSRGGSRVQFTAQLELDHALPYSPSPGIPQETEPVSHTADRLLRVLVADSDALNRRLLDMLLRKLGYVTMQAVTGADAVRLYERYDFDLIFLDTSMPKMNGISTANAIRAIELRSGRFTPVVIISAQPKEVALDKCKNAKVNDYLAKPIDRAALESTIARWAHPVAQ